MSAVEFKQVSKRYVRRFVLRDFSLQIAAAERVVLLGPSGCGKTTVLRLVAGFIAPDEGAIMISNEVVAADGRILKAPETRGIGMVFQDLALWPHMTVEGNLAFGLKARGVPKAERQARILEALQRVHLERRALAKPAELSGGEQQRVALARALVMEPRLLLMDEPLSSLDFELSLTLREEILRLQEILGFTLVYVTHNLEEAFFIAQRVMVMKAGEIDRIGPARAIRAHFEALLNASRTKEACFAPVSSPVTATDEEEVTMNCSKRVLKPVMALLFSLALSGQASWAQAAEPDTALIEQLTGAKGQWNEKEGVFKISVPRTDLDVTALHNHFFWDSPKVMFMHIGGRGDERRLAEAVGKVFAKSKETSNGKGNVPRAQIDPAKTSLDPKKIEDILGAKGEMAAGVYKITIGRTTKVNGHLIGNAMGINTWAAFAGSAEQAVVDGDFVMYEDELQRVLKALRSADIQIVAIHHHITEESPRTVFLHYWGVGSTTHLAKALKSALATLRSTP